MKKQEDRIKRRVTICDIAARAGVSHATVSRALHNHKEINIETRKAIWDIAKEMNYIPNVVARNLVSGTTRSIGVVIPDMGNNFFTKILAGVDDYANSSGYHVMLAQSRYNEEREIDAVRSMAERQVEGMIVCPSFSQFMEKIKEACNGVPLVFMSADASEMNCPFVVLDDVLAGRMATKFLLDLGHQNIVFLGANRNNNGLCRRIEGFQQVMEQNGLPSDGDHLLHSGMMFSDGYEQTERLIREHCLPDAILAGNDLLAIGALSALSDHGLQAPDDVSVMGFDGIDMAALPQISLTTIEQPCYEMGRIAVQILLRMSGRQNFTDLQTDLVARSGMVEPALKIRKTCGKNSKLD